MRIPLRLNSSNGETACTNISEKKAIALLIEQSQSTRREEENPQQENVRPWVNSLTNWLKKGSTSFRVSNRSITTAGTKNNRRTIRMALEPTTPTRTLMQRNQSPFSSRVVDLNIFLEQHHRTKYEAFLNRCAKKRLKTAA